MDTKTSLYCKYRNFRDTRDVFYVRREVDLMKTAKVNAYIMHIFGKIELLSIHATLNYFKIHYFKCLLKPRSYAQYTPRCKYTPGCKFAPGVYFGHINGVL